MENEPKSLSDIIGNISNKVIEKKANTPRSERAELLGQIYEKYRASNKTQNHKRYVKWLAENKFKHSEQKVVEFKKTKICLKARTIKSFAIMLAHIPTKDLYYILSIAKDKENRNENFGGWLMGEIYKK